MMQSVAAGAIVVPLESSANVVRDANVMVCRIGVAAQDVNNPLLDSVHACRGTQRSGPHEIRRISSNDSNCTHL